MEEQEIIDLKKEIINLRSEFSLFKKNFEVEQKIKELLVLDNISIEWPRKMRLRQLYDEWLDISIEQDKLAHPHDESGKVYDSYRYEWVEWCRCEGSFSCMKKKHSFNNKFHM